MKLSLLAFSREGFALAQRLAGALGGTAWRCSAPLGLEEWTARGFAREDGLIFVGAAGIAVRAIAPHLQDKTRDPAVVVVDEGGNFAVSLLSGHLGGANDLARRAAAACGAVPVITTATDVRGVFSVDAWARRQGCCVLNPQKIKEISSRLLAGGTVSLYSAFPVEGEPPAGIEPAGREGCGVCLDVRAGPEGALCLVPRIAVLGVGCRKGVSVQALELGLERLLEQSGLLPQAICAAASIDLKREEPGLLEFCRARGWPLSTFSAGQLEEVPGSFTPSPFVEKVTGVDNVCERSAVLASGGTLYWKKCAGDGVAMALALRPYAPDWRWRDE